MEKDRSPTNNFRKASARTTGETGKAWFSALKDSWRAVLRLDRSQLATLPALRSAIGFGIPLALGVATGHVLVGVSLAGGALSLGNVGLTSPYHTRVRTMLLACLGIALSAFVGSITGPIAWLSVLVAGIWGIGAGLLVSLGQSAMTIGLQAAIALIILSHFMLSPTQALLQAALMFAGALFQLMLALLPMPGRRTAPERAALFTVYSYLADYASHPTDTQRGQPIRDALLKAQNMLTRSNNQRQAATPFFELLEEAERLRLSLLGLRRLRQQLAEENETQTESIALSLDGLLEASAAQLRDIASELKPPIPLTHRTKPHQQIKQALAIIRQQASTQPYDETIQQVLVYGDALRDQLHTARKLATSWQHHSLRLSLHLRFPRPPHLHLHHTQTTLRANLTLRSAIFRHAIRLGVALALATALYRLLPLPLERGYWIALTAVLVLRPEFGTTFTRGVARSLGTIFGAVFATLLGSLLASSLWLLVIFDAVADYLASAVLFVNYAMFSVFITIMVVLLLTFVTPQPVETAWYRAIDTAVGGILALLIYALWPSWERSQVPGNLADRLDNLRSYLVAVLNAYAHPAAYDSDTFHNLRMESRLARSNAEASVGRALQEPASHGIDADFAQGLLEAADGLADSAMALDAYLLDNPKHPALPEMAPFAGEVDKSLQLLAIAVREKRSVPTMPDLQEALHRIQRKARSAAYRLDERHTDLRLVLAEAKRITRIINTLHHLLSTS